MKSTLKTAAIFFTILSILIAFGCTKNQSPTIKIIQPNDKLVIEKDTVLSIVLNVNDPDGEISLVQIMIDGKVVKEFDTSPYQYDWEAKYNNLGNHKIQAFAMDDKGSIAQDEISIDIKDYRLKYYGNYYFKVKTEEWMMGSPRKYHTNYYNGVIREYKLVDSEHDLYSLDDTKENPDVKITIEFLKDTHITSKLCVKNGKLCAKIGYHYTHYGGFIGTDTIKFNIDGLGGMGAGWNYKVQGVRK